MSDLPANHGVLSLTAQIVSAHIARNRVAPHELPDIIRQVYRTLIAAGAPAAPARPTPAVPIHRSVFEDHIVCLEDGKKLKTLKRHLKAVYDLTPEQYRARWGLPADYPMVAPEYARRRSSLAREIGLGSHRRTAPG